MCHPNPFPETLHAIIELQDPVSRLTIINVISTVSAPCDAHDVRGKPQSTNMVAKIKKGKKFK